MNQLNAEGVQALRELGESQLRETCKDEVLVAVATCGLVDLNQSIAAYHEAQLKAEEIMTEIQGLETKITELKEEAKTLESQAKFLVVQEEEFASVTPLDATDMLRVLFSLVYEIRQAIYIGRGYTEKRFGFSYYQLAFLERFVLPALEGRLSPEWSTDDMWASTVDTQITQRIFSHLRDKKESSWANVFAELKKNLSPERLHILVAGVCEGEQCDVGQLKTLIAQLREKSKEWPAKYQTQ